ncbi:hypothetical protein M407DRAFT_17926 [Tulasnella calospora MUT 4182]|uniref:Uncharacterized protein n=1 Tax=Tulasnella calospora MUT 4182 TaxID=1051891 RepID=A0A0C3QWS5_9AGAM|nr:hypothetical protein M407DRAFT_17926 [Tulasnella calospora MUT 4182]
MDDDTSKSVVMATIVILLFAVVVGITVGARTPIACRAPLSVPSRNGRKLNTSVYTVPSPGRYIQQSNVERNDIEGHPTHSNRVPRSVHSLGSLRHPPPTYGAHHLDPRCDGVPYGYGLLGSAGGDAVDIVPAPLPPSYNADLGEGQPPL